MAIIDLVSVRTKSSISIGYLYARRSSLRAGTLIARFNSEQGITEVMQSEIILMSDKASRIQEHAYYLWEKAGRPQGSDLEHWLEAERELSGQSDARRNQDGDTASDDYGIHAAERYNREVQRSVVSSKSEQAVSEAQRAVEGPKRESLKRAKK